MAQRVPWDMSEAVIMLNALIAAREGRMSRKDAIVAVSSELRSRAKRNGIEVDDIFRNVNGITLQMSTMEYILTDGEKGMKKSSMPKLERSRKLNIARISALFSCSSFLLSSIFRKTFLLNFQITIDISSELCGAFDNCSSHQMHPCN